MEQVIEVGEIVANAGSRLATHVWRAAAIGNLGGWQVSRTLHLLNVLTGSVGTEGGLRQTPGPSSSPSCSTCPGPGRLERPALPSRVHPLSLRDEPHTAAPDQGRRGSMDVYFTRVFNPVWTYPDGFSWIEMLQNEDSVGCHIALTPTWNETAFFADYVLPMGHASERHDVNSYATSSGKWVAFRQPVLREYARREGRRSSSPTRSIPARSGRRTSSGTSYLGGSTMAPWGSGSTSRARTGRARGSPSTSTTSTCSRGYRPPPRLRRRRALTLSVT